MKRYLTIIISKIQGECMFNLGITIFSDSPHQRNSVFTQSLYKSLQVKLIV